MDVTSSFLSLLLVFGAIMGMSSMPDSGKGMVMINALMVMITHTGQHQRSGQLACQNAGVGRVCVLDVLVSCRSGKVVGGRHVGLAWCELVRGALNP